MIMNLYVQWQYKIQKTESGSFEFEEREIKIKVAGLQNTANTCLFNRKIKIKK